MLNAQYRIVHALHDQNESKVVGMRAVGWVCVCVCELCAYKAIVLDDGWFLFC